MPDPENVIVVEPAVVDQFPLVKTGLLQCNDAAPKS
jgi:hypothetical protein